MYNYFTLAFTLIVLTCNPIMAYGAFDQNDEIPPARAQSARKQFTKTGIFLRNMNEGGQLVILTSKATATLSDTKNVIEEFKRIFRKLHPLFKYGFSPTDEEIVNYLKDLGYEFVIVMPEEASQLPVLSLSKYDGKLGAEIADISFGVGATGLCVAPLATGLAVIPIFACISAMVNLTGMAIDELLTELDLRGSWGEEDYYEDYNEMRSRLLSLELQ